jgi:cell division protein FtsX
MRNGRKISKTTSEILRCVTLACLCIFFTIIANNYYQIKNYASALSEELKIFVFFDKNLNANECEKTLKSIDSTESILIKEYVNADEAYRRVVKQNPFLGRVCLSDNSKSVQSYAIAKLQSIPDSSNFLCGIKNALDSIRGVEEVVFDTLSFLHYAKIQKQLSLYEKSFFIVVLSFLIILIFKFLLAYIAGANMLHKGLMFLMCILSSSIGFLLFFVMCKYYWHCSLLVPPKILTALIFFSSVIGIVFDKTEIE